MEKKDIISFLKTDWSFSFKDKFPSPKDAYIYDKFGWIWPSVFEKKSFEFRRCIFEILIISPWRRKWPFIWK